MLTLLQCDPGWSRWDCCGIEQPTLNGAAEGNEIWVGDNKPGDQWGPGRDLFTEGEAFSFFPGGQMNGWGQGDSWKVQGRGRQVLHSTAHLLGQSKWCHLAAPAHWFVFLPQVPWPRLGYQVVDRCWCLMGFVLWSLRTELNTFFSLSCFWFCFIICFSCSSLIFIPSSLPPLPSFPLPPTTNPWSRQHFL